MAPSKDKIQDLARGKVVLAPLAQRYRVIDLLHPVVPSDLIWHPHLAQPHIIPCHLHIINHSHMFLNLTKPLRIRKNTGALAPYHRNRAMLPAKPLTCYTIAQRVVVLVAAHQRQLLDQLASVKRIGIYP